MIHRLLFLTLFRKKDKNNDFKSVGTEQQLRLDQKPFSKLRSNFRNKKHIFFLYYKR